MFTGSKEIQDSYAPVPVDDFRCAVTAVFSAEGIAPAEDLRELICRCPTAGRFKSWLKTADMLAMLNITCPHGQALRRFMFAHHVLRDLPGTNPFQLTQPYPPQVGEIARVGALGLVEYGFDQFVALRRVCNDIVAWAKRRGEKRIALLESPLGNVVPVAALARLLTEAGISAEVVSLRHPRNPRARTYQDAIDGACRRIAASSCPWVYLDDILTGTRFAKTLKYLEKAAKKHGIEKPIAVGMEFTSHDEPPSPHQGPPATISSKLKSGQQADGPTAWHEMPQLPRLRIDAGDPIVYPSPVVWGENDIVAGLRKVNLIFDWIAHLKQFHGQLVGSRPGARDVLRRLWSEDTSGQRFVILDDEVLRHAIAQSLSRVDWRAIQKEAAADFPEDNFGRVEVPLDNAFIACRRDWLQKQITAADTSGTSFGWNALNTLFQASETFTGDSRNRDFCYMFLPYNPTISILHSTIVSEVVSPRLAAAFGAWA